MKKTLSIILALCLVVGIFGTTRISQAKSYNKVSFVSWKGSTLRFKTFKTKGKNPETWKFVFSKTKKAKITKTTKFYLFSGVSSEKITKAQSKEKLTGSGFCLHKLVIKNGKIKKLYVGYSAG